MKKVKSGDRKSKSMETKKRIVEEAAKLFSKDGFEGVSVDSIVEAAGVSKGTFYVHFESKSALIALLTSDYVTKLDLGYKSYLDSISADAKASEIIILLTDKIFDAIINIVGYDVMRIIYDVQLTKTANMEFVMGYNRELYKMVNFIICRGVEQGEFISDISPEIIAKHFILAMRGLTYEWLIRYPDYNLREEALTHIKILMSGIRKQ